MDFLKMCLLFIKKYINFIKIKKIFLKILNISCILLLIYNALDMTLNYLKFPYKYKMLIQYEKGIYLPPISLCTASHVMFDKNKVNQYFNVEDLWLRYESDAQNHYDHQTKNTRYFKDFCKFSRFDRYFAVPPKTKDSWKWRMNYCLSLFHKQYKKYIERETNFHEMNSLTIDGKDLFDFSLNTNERNEFNFDSNDFGFFTDNIK